MSGPYVAAPPGAAASVETSHGRDVLVVGESLVDIVRGADGETVEYAGGSAANVAVALARLGRPVRFATSCADDERGRLVADHLDARRGARWRPTRGAVARTSTAAATIGADGAASLRVRPRVAAQPGAGDEPTRSSCTPARSARCSSRAPTTSSSCWRGSGAPRRSATTSTPGPRSPAPVPTSSTRVERMAPSADLVKASDEDLAALYPDVDLVTAARRLLALGPAAVVVTRGGDGATGSGRDDVVEVDSLPVTVADTIGAGDTFGAALIDALWERGRLGADRRDGLRDLARDEIVEVLAHAARAAAVTVSRPGATRRTATSSAAGTAVRARAPARRARAGRRTRPRRWPRRPASSSPRGCRRPRRCPGTVVARLAGGSPSTHRSRGTSRPVSTKLLVVAGDLVGQPVAARLGAEQQEQAARRHPGRARRCWCPRGVSHSSRPSPPPSTTLRAGAAPSIRAL